jgi:DNA-binding transcriptional MerR regulator
MAVKDVKLYYSMGEVAEMMDVSTSLLRFWEQKFDILKPHKNKKGNRMFTPEDVRNLKTIYHLVKERGMTLAGADKYLKANRQAIERDVEIAERLGTIRALLLEVRHELGGGGTIVDGDVPEEIVAPATVIKSIGEIEEVEVVIVPQHEPELTPELEQESKQEPQPEPESKSKSESVKLQYIEQTLF